MSQVGDAYLPTDRYFALLRGEELPNQASGAVLFADISGFTPLTEAYARLLGARLGAEELARQLNKIYDALIAEVSRFGGSVVSFGGDAITCWFHETGPTVDCETASARAVASAAAMQEAMAAFSALELPDGSEVRLGVKIAISSGEVRRFLVGDATIHLIDILAGDPVTRVAALEHGLFKGEIGVDPSFIRENLDLLKVDGWRWSDELGEAFACVSGVRRAVKPAPWPDKANHILSEAVVRPWLFPEVFRSLQLNEHELSAELRPVAALFLRFHGIDYSDPEFGHSLDRFIRWAQRILGKYDAPLVHVTLGDKGSYFYAVFGAPTAHEDYSRRAVSAALELRTSATATGDVDEVQIGISQGTVWVGAYGAVTRRTYGVHGDEVNVAARLMQHAKRGEILGTGHVKKTTVSEFAWEDLPPLTVKGKAQPLSVSRLVGRHTDYQRTVPVYSGALVGREEQLRKLVDYIDLVKEDQAPGVMYVAGEPGMGKSRLIYELRRQVKADAPDILWMICPTDELFRDSLHPFRHYLGHYFRQSDEKSPDDNRTCFKSVLDRLLTTLEQQQRTDLRDELVRTEAFLGALVDLYWEDSGYLQVEPRQRFERTIEGLLALFDAESLFRPVVVQIEDGQWLDSDSTEFICLLIQRDSAAHIGIIITSRFQDDGHPWSLPLDLSIPQQTVLLQELSPDGVAALGEQVLGVRVSADLAAYLSSKTGGNPFFVEQFVLDLRERGLLRQSDVTGCTVSEETLVEVPTNVSAILIARLDRLAPRVKTVVQTGSVLGNEFEVRILSQMLPASFNVHALVEAAEAASVWTMSSDNRYVFRHTLLRDAAYHMQLSATLRDLHRLAGSTIESVYGEEAGLQALELAYHYESANDFPVAAGWYARAGDNAIKIYALEDVSRYYQNALLYWRISKAPADVYRFSQLKVLLELGNALRWRNRSQEAMGVFQEAHIEAVRLNDLIAESDACIGLANVQYDEGDFRSALTNAVRAEQIAAAYGISRRLRTALEMKCWCLLRLGDLSAARASGEEAVMVSSELGEQGHLAQSLSVLGLVLMAAGEMKQASEHFEHALAIAEDPMDVVGITNNLGVIAMAEGDYERAALHYEEALLLARQHNIAEAELVFRSNLGGARVGLGHCEQAETELREVITLVGDSGFGDLSETYRFLAEALLGQGRVEEALAAAQRALALGAAVGAPEFIAIAWRVLGQVAAWLPAPVRIPEPESGVMREYTPSQCFEESMRISEATGMKGEIPRTLRSWALFELQKGRYEVGVQMVQQAIEGFLSVGAPHEVERTRLLERLDDL